MAEPKRIQRRRTKNWRMPEGARYVGRGTIYGNPFRIGAPHPLTGEPMTPAICADLYRRGVEAGMSVWKGGPASYLHPDQSEVYDAWEALTPHLTPVGIGLEIDKLRGLDLACWCPLDRECHGDFLLAIANSEARRG